MTGIVELQPLRQGLADQLAALLPLNARETAFEELGKLFERGFSRIEWEQRRKLLHKPLAQWLQFYYASHAKPVPVSVTFLRDTSGSATQVLWKFRQNLKAALGQIQAVGVISDWQIDSKTDLVHVTRIPSPSQLKHLSNQQE